MDYNTRLQVLQDQIYRKKKLEAMLKDLHQQNDELLETISALEEVKLKEQKDVERLEGNKLASFYYELIGKKDEKISKEKAEAYAATLKYDSRVQQLKSVTEDIMGLEKEMVLFMGCENQYKKLMDEKTQWMKDNNTKYNEEINEFEEKIRYLNSQIKEIEEAIHVGNKAMAKIESIENELSSAEGWGTWDLCGGGLLSDMAKHSHLDDAQDMIVELQELLRCFRTELADITIHADIQVQVNGFLRAADFLFDGLLADWAVLDSIHSSQSEISETKSKIQDVLNKLYSLKNTAENEINSFTSELEELIRKA